MKDEKIEGKFPWDTFDRRARVIEGSKISEKLEVLTPEEEADFVKRLKEENDKKDRESAD